MIATAIFLLGWVVELRSARGGDGDYARSGFRARFSVLLKCFAFDLPEGGLEGGL